MRSSSPMLPMLDLAGRFFLVGRDYIVGAEVSAASAGAENLASSVPARIETTGGHVFRGKPPILADPAQPLSVARG